MPLHGGIPKKQIQKESREEVYMRGCFCLFQCWFPAGVPTPLALCCGADFFLHRFRQGVARNVHAIAQKEVIRMEERKDKDGNTIRRLNLWTSKDLHNTLAILSHKTGLSISQIACLILSRHHTTFLDEQIEQIKA